MNLSFIGPSGSGKGTYSAALVKELWLEHISTGDLLRQNLADQTVPGLLTRHYMDQGELVPDELVEGMVEDWVRKSDPGGDILFDGFPRTEYQARFLDDLFAKLGGRLDGVILFNVSEAEMLRRLAGRLICRQCQTPFHRDFKRPKQEGVCDRCGGALYQRDDDNPATVRARLRTFHARTKPLIHFYQDAGLLKEVAGQGDLAAVTAHALAAARAVQNAIT